MSIGQGQRIPQQVPCRGIMKVWHSWAFPSLFFIVSPTFRPNMPRTEASQIVQALQNNQPTRFKFSLKGDLLYYKDGIFVVASFPWRHCILAEFHSSSTAGHFGFLQTYKRVLRNFNFPCLKKEVNSFVAGCDTCQRTNYETLKSSGLLQPLPIPTQIWTDIAMNFIENLPSTYDRNAILVVVDRLSKYGHFIPIKHSYSATKVADIFIREIFHLHGMLAIVVSARDPIFISQF